MKIRTPWPLSSTLLLLLSAQTGCDAMSHPDYHGEPLATLQGQVTVKDSSYQPPETEVVLMWLKTGNAVDDINLIAEKVAVKGVFPAAFQLDLYQPPPRILGIEYQGVRLHGASIAAFKKGDVNTGDELFPQKDPEKAFSLLNKILAQAEEEVVYLDQDIASDHPFAILGGGITKKGFHLLQPIPLAQGEAQRRYEACRKIFATQADLCGLEQMGSAPVPEGLENHRIGLQLGPDRGAGQRQ
jgi:hypothetical protein